MSGYNLAYPASYTCGRESGKVLYIESFVEARPIRLQLFGIIMVTCGYKLVKHREFIEMYGEHAPCDINRNVMSCTKINYRGLQVG